MKDLQPLVARLKACPAREISVSPEILIKRWEEVRQEKVSAFIPPGQAVMAALIVSDARFASLLPEPDRAQLQSLVRQAADHYEQLTHPANPLGKLIIGTVKSI